MSPDHDRILEQALKHELRGGTVQPGDACIDAEALAAWMDGGLDAATVAAMEAHASSCPRCQELIAAMGRTPPVTPAIGGERVNSGQSWWKWLVPISAAAAAAVIWMVVPGQRELAVAPPRPPAADAPAPAPARTDSVQPVAPVAAASETRARAIAPAEAAKSLDKPSQEPAKEKDQKLAEKIVADRDQARNVNALKAEEQAKLEAAPAAAPAPASPPPPPPPAARAVREEAFGASSSDRLSKRVASAAVIEVASPDARRRWRVTAESIERTDNGGSSWAMVHLLRGELLAAGSSPSTTVCWFVGTNGVVMITVDASLFTHVDVPGRPNLTSIAATDARSAVAAASDGRRFHTDDSGRTWREN